LQVKLKIQLFDETYQPESPDALESEGCDPGPDGLERETQVSEICVVVEAGPCKCRFTRINKEFRIQTLPVC